jgi:peroxiredoxin
MIRSDNLYNLPNNLPIPIDDGACDHLTGKTLPSILLNSTNFDPIDLSKISNPFILYCYPRTGQPDQDPPEGWNEIPGARGCTPQCIGYRNSYNIFIQFGFQVFGLSTQTTDYQKEAATRLHLPFPLLSDSGLLLTTQLNLPTIEIASMKVIKRLTMIIRDKKIIKVFYPVFPSDKDAEMVLKWMQEL